MQYKEFKDLRLSALGFGAMRLPVIDGDESRIDEAAAAEMVDFAMKSGINYFDTAWGYHSENSETVMGRILKAYPRESFYLATKFPGYDPENLNRMEEIFSRQMEKLQTDYFDFYLVHNVCEVNIEYYLNPDLMEFLREQKAAGKIRHLGFSVHGTFETMKRFLEAFSEDMEFCQIQLNWFDWEFQDAKAKVELLREYGIPFIVMEPLRGGKLASLPADAEEELKALRPDETIPAWSFRYLQSFADAFVVLSGMSNMAQLEENIKTFETDAPVTEEETKALYKIADSLKKGVPCTACRYCTTACPKGLDIPHLLFLYNEYLFTDGGIIAKIGISAVPEEKMPSACISCGKCERLCPQVIPVSLAFREFTEILKKDQ